MSKWWVTLQAAGPYILGRNASEKERWRRAAICAACDNLVTYEEELEILPAGLFTLPPHTGFCGQERTPRPELDQCGCGVLAESPVPTGLTVKGRPVMPAMKTTKMASKCPRWARKRGG